MEFTPRSLTQRVVDLELASQAEIDRLWVELRSSEVELDEVKNLLLRKGILTNFQLDRLLTASGWGSFTALQSPLHDRCRYLRPRIPSRS